MKKIYLFLFLIITSAGSCFAEPEPLAQTLSPAELQYLAAKLKDPECIIGMFSLPTGKDPMRKVTATGDYPESDTNYIHLAIDFTLMKFNTIEMLKGKADEVIFVNMPFGGISEEVPITFYSYPGTDWMLILNKGIIDHQPAGWVKNIKDLAQYKWLNSETAFISDPYKGNYNLKWNGQFELPQGVIKINRDIFSDVKALYDGIKDLPKDMAREEYNAKIAPLKAGMKTEDGKRLCEMMEK